MLARKPECGRDVFFCVFVCLCVYVVCLPCLVHMRAVHRININQRAQEKESHTYFGYAHGDTKNTKNKMQHFAQLPMDKNISLCICNHTNTLNRQTKETNLCKVFAKRPKKRSLVREIRQIINSHLSEDCAGNESGYELLFTVTDHQRIHRISSLIKDRLAEKHLTDINLSDLRLFVNYKLCNQGQLNHLQRSQYRITLSFIQYIELL